MQDNTHNQYYATIPFQLLNRPVYMFGAGWIPFRPHLVKCSDELDTSHPATQLIADWASLYNTGLKRRHTMLVWNDTADFDAPTACGIAGALTVRTRSLDLGTGAEILQQVAYLVANPQRFKFKRGGRTIATYSPKPPAFWKSFFLGQGPGSIPIVVKRGRSEFS